jgi:S1-C subfamily serine protease
MKLRYTLVASLLLFCGTSQAQLSAEQCRSIVSIKEESWLGDTQGTGFFISKERVLTAEHIGDNAKWIMTRDGRKLPCYLEKRGRFELLDWAILRVPNANGTPLKLAKDTAPQGTQVWAYGDFNCVGRALEVTSGYVTGCGDWGLRYASAPVYPGFSGGPVVDKADKVVGITSRQASAGNQCIYVPIMAVRKAAGL